MRGVTPVGRSLPVGGAAVVVFVASETPFFAGIAASVESSEESPHLQSDPERASTLRPVRLQQLL
jgi:hypothetical protein